MDPVGSRGPAGSLSKSTRANTRSQAGVIVTFNLKDFPPEALAPYNVEAQHPDEFIAHQFDLSPAAVVAAVRDQRLALKNPPKTARELLDTLLPAFFSRP